MNMNYLSEEQKEELKNRLEKAYDTHKEEVRGRIKNILISSLTELMSFNSIDDCTFEELCKGISEMLSIMPEDRRDIRN